MIIDSKIKKAIESNNLIAFVGSGCSAKFGLPNWKNLVLDIIKEVDKKEYDVFAPVLDIDAMSPIEVLEKLKPEHNLIKKYIKDNYKIKESEDFTLHKKIFDLTKGVITTNFDNSFEIALNKTVDPSIFTSSFNISEIDKDGKPYIFKLHGTYSEPDNCVLFKEDYNNLYINKKSAAREKLKSLFTNKVILFIGFSFSDIEINHIFENLDKAFGNNNKHFILTTNPDEFKYFDFLNPIGLSSYDEIDVYIDKCLNYKKDFDKIENKVESDTFKNNKSIENKIALLTPNPIDLDFKDELNKVISNFNNIDLTFYKGTLNVETLLSLEDFDLIIIISKVFKKQIYIEDENLKSYLMSIDEICYSIPNPEIPVVFITNEEVQKTIDYNTVLISTFKNALIKKFVYKAFRLGKLDFLEENIWVNIKNLFDNEVKAGKAKFKSIYGSSRSLSIGMKSLTNVIGRVEEQSSLVNRIKNATKSHRLLNIKASGGTGKTTLIKKIAYELYNRGYYREGVTFKSCESIKSYGAFEELLIEGFQLANIIDFKEYLSENFHHEKIDLLIILDNFETVVNSLDEQEYKCVLDLLKFTTDFATILITSRDRISVNDDFEDVYSLTPLITEDALTLFQISYGEVKDPIELRILRTEILEDLLNNNPLAIKLVTNSSIKFKKIFQLKEQLTTHFFESTNSDYSKVFENDADLNIERKKSIYQSINYSYSTLNHKEKIGLEILSLFPDGISLSDFKKCFKNQKSVNHINENHLRALKDKSLIEDYNGTLQLQPIIRRFAEFQFSNRSVEVKQDFCTDAYSYNCFLLDVLELIEKKRGFSESIKIFNLYKNNMINVLYYIPDIKVDKDTSVPEKKYLLNYIYSVEDFFINEQILNKYVQKLIDLNSYFSDLPNANILLDVMRYVKQYFYSEFDNSYSFLNKLFSVEEMENRDFSNEDYLETRYKNLIANIHGMEGYTLQRVKSLINNDFQFSTFIDANFFYLGIPDNISRDRGGFYKFEYDLMEGNLDESKLEDIIDSLFMDEHLEIVQCTYTLSKVKNLKRRVIQKLVVTNPYTKGLKELMFAFVSNNNQDKVKHFENAIKSLFHIKYYYLEALYYYCLYLKETDFKKFKIKLKEGLIMSAKFHYQYLLHLFTTINSEIRVTYDFSYSFYPIEGLEPYVIKHNEFWKNEYEKIDS